MSSVLRTFLTLVILLTVAVGGALFLAYRTTGSLQIVAHVFLVPGHLVDMAVSGSFRGSGGATGLFTIGFGTWIVYLLPLSLLLRLG